MAMAPVSLIHWDWRRSCSGGWGHGAGGECGPPVSSPRTPHPTQVWRRCPALSPVPGHTRQHTVSGVSYWLPLPFNLNVLDLGFYFDDGKEEKAHVLIVFTEF